MAHKIKTVKSLNSFILSVIFQSGIEKTYDIRSLIGIYPQFKKFEGNPSMAEQVKVDVGGYGISWNDELDIDAEELWENGIETGILHEVDIREKVGDILATARVEVGLTQKQLAENTGIYQADISKIERGLANPSVETLGRLAEGMNLRLNIEFVSKGE